MGFGPIRRLWVGGDGAGEKEVKCFPPFLTVGAYRAYHRPQVEAPGQEESRAAKGCGGRWWGHLAGRGEAGKAWALCGCSLCSDFCLLFWSSVSESKRRDSAFLSCSILSILPWPPASHPWQLLPWPLVAPEPCPAIAASYHARRTPGSSSSGEFRSWWGLHGLGVRATYHGTLKPREGLTPAEKIIFEGRYLLRFFPHSAASHLLMGREWLR